MPDWEDINEPRPDLLAGGRCWTCPDLPDGVLELLHRGCALCGAPELAKGCRLPSWRVSDDVELLSTSVRSARHERQEEQGRR